ncbi:MAG: hypothetical protein HY078_05865 [Elusimicrobia bacterium]|nr:hypothetical protein [Elusimicrobiota bacterium]
MTFRRKLLLIAAVACALRAGCALLTRSHPIFPAYYYGDARLIEETAWNFADNWGKGNTYELSLVPSQRLYAFVIASFYHVAGRRDLVVQLCHVAASSVGVLLLALAISSAFGEAMALATALIIALWPSHIFYSSQIFKDGLVMFFAYGTLGAWIPLLERERPSRADAALLALGALALLVLGSMRAHVLIVLSAALLAASFARLAAAAQRRTFDVLAAAIVGIVILVLFNHGIIADHTPTWTVRKTDSPAPVPQPLLPQVQTELGKNGYMRPLSPAGLTEFRRVSLRSDRLYAEGAMNRKIGTQLFPNERFDSLWDVAKFIPKNSFFVLFMPLPGLYPMEGKLGRWLSAFENTVLLILFAAAVVGASRMRWTPSRSVFLLTFLAMAVGSSLLEFDLGSANRHKAFYLPLVFPFIAAIRKSQSQAAAAPVLGAAVNS